MTLYETLGVDNDADAQEIKLAYRRLAMEFHPDRNPGDVDAEEKFRKINQAYEVLIDEDRREQYDRRLSVASPVDSPVSPDKTTHFGMGRKTHGGNRNADVQVDYTVSLEEAFWGKEIEISYVVHNEGRKRARIKVPPGIKSGMKIRYEGLGSGRHPEIPPGDLYVKVIIRRHPVFEQKDDDLHAVISVDALDAILGTTAEIKAIDEQVISIPLPERVQNKQIIRVPGHGMPAQEGRGDLFVVVEITIPKKIPLDELEILEQLRDLRGRKSSQTIDNPSG